MTDDAVTQDSPQRANALATGVAVFAGTLLLIAAILKGYTAVMPGPAIALHLRLRDLALIEFELALGAMLILNLRPAQAWGLALAAYAVFAGVSVQKVMMGAKSCGCFGPAAVDPKIMVAIDVAIVAMLLVAGPRSATPHAARSSGLRRAGMAVAVVLVLAAAAGVAFAAVPKRGLIASEEGAHDFGKITAAQSLEHIFTVRNTASAPVQITGYKSSCGCTMAEVPTGPIAPGASANVVVRATWDKFTGRTASTVTLETDNRWTPKVALTISGEVVSEP